MFFANGNNENVSPYSNQLENGYRGLNFKSGLEKEFRDFYLELNLWRIRWAQFVAIPIFILFGIYEINNWSEYAVFWSIVIRFIVLCPIWVSILLLTFCIRLRSKLYSIIEFGLVVVCAGTVCLSLIAINCDDVVRFEGLLLMQCFILLFTGIIFRRAIFFSLLILVPFTVGELLIGVEHNIVIFHVLMLFVANIFGMLSCYFFEYSSRTNFLKTKLLNEMAEKDGLTGIYNRRMFEIHLDRVWRQAAREKEVFAVAMIDVDYFKAYNDYYGHQKGDDTLRQVADILSCCENRPLDMVARYGGEEFVVVWYGANYQQVAQLSEKLRSSISGLDISHAMSCITRKITVSVGVALVMPSDVTCSPDKLVALADKALYEAKHKGRDRVILKELREP